ncbi:MAG TPA: His/Gly/Thr/Pro-type tRNA ligase C-terminal domain-containing protein [Candidatus Paceibacterota bacterium]|nr:His/Gly/Thr/Pro-type tRNA ligase C-terminal domain-containing protein [Candidatus Paceibacterota bacterium]
MIRIRDTRHQSTAALLGNAIAIAEYYGFAPLEEALRAQSGKRLPPLPKNDTEISFTRREERPLAQIARRAVQFARAGAMPESGAHLFWRTTQGNGSIPSISLELHVVGARGAIAEALLLIVASTIAQEAGLPERVLSINNIGSFESSNRYVRDVGTYLRKHIDTISPTLRPRAATDPLGTLVQLIERGHPAVPRAPQAMEYLTEEERRRFWEILEYLEFSGLSYELSPSILGSRDCWAHALYEISTMDQETNTRIPIAFGGRYDPLAARFGAPTGAATITISYEIKGKTRVKREVAGVPSIYFAHLGLEARRASLKALEILRHAEIPVYHSLLFERIGEQMLQAKGLAAPYVLIMGYKEATEGTIMVREVATNSQESIPLPELPGYLKRRRVGNSRSGIAA